ncbi:IscS subfamily cysteine desulfurase [Metabacillus malikii]|uniref:IscS subfamily cysteine desulfurase n=1 Tax=Metabacillus malikii TaxID=1504265 RepID=UPI00352075A8
MLIYLDYAATTPMSEDAISMYVKAAKDAFGNSSSLHDIGGFASQTLDASRKLIASLIGGTYKGLFFTGSGSEANTLAIQSLLNGVDSSKKHIITTQIEHSSIFNYFKKLAKEGYDVTFLKPDKHGYIEKEQVDKALRADTCLVSIQHGNSELGIIQPLAEIGKLLKTKHVLFHSDCVQTFGKVPVNVDTLGLDAVSISSHKIHGPKGIGAAYVQPSVYWQPVIEGTTHESGFRPGTVDVPAVAAFAVAAKKITDSMSEQHHHFKELRKSLIQHLEPISSRITILNNDEHTILSNIFPVCVSDIEGQYIMLECNRYGFAISTGSACQVGMQEPSRSLLAIGYDEHKAKQYIRVSFGVETSESQILAFAETLIKTVNIFHQRDWRG